MREIAETAIDLDFHPFRRQDSGGLEQSRIRRDRPQASRDRQDPDHDSIDLDHAFADQDARSAARLTPAGFWWSGIV